MRRLIKSSSIWIYTLFPFHFIPRRTGKENKNVCVLFHDSFEEISVPICVCWRQIKKKWNFKISVFDICQLRSCYIQSPKCPRKYLFSLLCCAWYWTSVCLPTRLSVFLFPDDNLSKWQLIFNKLGMCIDIEDIWIRIANGRISSGFDTVICPPHDSSSVLSFHVFIDFWLTCRFGKMDMSILNHGSVHFKKY